MANLSGKTERIKEIHITGNQAADIVISGQKERAEHMGIVTRTVKKYGGECVFQCKDNVFSCKIMLPLEKNE